MPVQATEAPTLGLFVYDWDKIAYDRLAKNYPMVTRGFDLFSFPSNAHLAFFDMERWVNGAARLARRVGAQAVVSQHEQFGALCSALLAEKMGWPGTSVHAVLACQHKLYARQVLQAVCPEANVDSMRLPVQYGADIPPGLPYPRFVKPVKAAFSVLAREVDNRDALQQHTRFGVWELWVIRHLVEPFEKVCRKRLPDAGTAHSLMLETPVHGRQYCLDGYAFKGRYTFLGCVDSIMYPGTQSFMRFQYPSHLPDPIQQRAMAVAERFLAAIGFEHGLFNMEFFYDADTDSLKVIEFNPRMASQFSDLYQKVDGIDLHAFSLELAHGRDPALLPRVTTGHGVACSFVYRSFDASQRPPMPSTAQKRAWQEAFPDGLLFDFPKDQKSLQRDFKWLQSHRYGIVHLGASDWHALRARCEHASRLLGWPAPYAANEAQPATKALHATHSTDPGAFTPIPLLSTQDIR